MKHTKNIVMLLLTAIIWGFAFCAQSAAMESIGPLAFNMLRSILGGLVLIPIIPFLDRIKSQQEKEIEKSYLLKDLLIGGLCCGVALGTASAMQQIGIKYTTVGKAGFITACYIILVPIFGIFLKKRCSIFVWISIIIAVAGLYLLCMNESFSIAKGDLFVIACAFLFTFQILFIDHFAPKCDCVRLACIQFFVAGILSLIGMFFMEGMPQLSQIRAALLPILYAGIMSSGVAYTLQMVGQKNFNPTIASLIMSLESTFAA
ncbi:MAG: DMT family transporter, partial [Victivallales bacterium]|nr:DMT family transporter [Victivallales bacterium]